MQRIQLFTRAAALAAACTVASVASAQTPQQSSAAKPNQPAAQVSSEDTAFAQKAAEAGMKEVQQGKMAAQKASNAQVKAYGNKLVKDHTAANKELMAIAKRKNIDLPLAEKSDRRGSVGARNDATPDTKTGVGHPENPTGTTGATGRVETTGQARDRMAQSEPWMSETGAAFDKGFIDAQVKAHEEAIALFEKESQSGSDNELKAFASKQLPGLRDHLKQAQDLQQKLSTTTR